MIHHKLEKNEFQATLELRSRRWTLYLRQPIDNHFHFVSEMNSLKKSSHLFSTLHHSWQQELEIALESSPLQGLEKFLDEQWANKNKIIYPKREHLFKAFELTPFKKTKVIILGQDPYHGERQAMGLAFSVPAGCALPPSLKNIFKEYESDLGLISPRAGDLSPWAREGVLLLNTCLTVEAGQAGSHQNRGWEYFTDQVIRVLSERKEHLVFVLWGNPAQKKITLINQQKHFVIQAPHPSPLSSYRGFFGSKPFSKINHYLRERHLEPIEWQL
jgi:uracil-DNA glycosylase